MRADSTKYIDRSEKKRTQKLKTAKPQTSMLNFITRIPKPENNPEIEIKTYINRPRSHSDIYKHLEKNKKQAEAEVVPSSSLVKLS